MFTWSKQYLLQNITQAWHSSRKSELSSEDVDLLAASLMSDSVYAASNLMKHEKDKDRASRKAVLYPSNLGKCPRQLALTVSGAPYKTPEIRVKVKFMIGNLVEAALCALFDKVGRDTGEFTLTNAQQRVSPMVWSDKYSRYEKLSGKIDRLLYWQDKIFIFEMKSTRERTFFNLVKEGPNNVWGYETQVAQYLEAFRQRNFHVDGVYHVTVSPSSGDWCEYLGVLEEGVDVQQQARDLVAVVDLAEDGFITPRPEWAKSEFHPRVKNDDGTTGCYRLTDARCGYCPVVETCWPGVKSRWVGGEKVWEYPQTKETGGLSI